MSLVLSTFAVYVQILCARLSQVHNLSTNLKSCVCTKMQAGIIASILLVENETPLQLL